MSYSETDLILNPDGSVYHLHLRPEHIADTILVVGDPDRVPMVSQYFDTLEHRTNKREFITHTGTLSGKRLSVISSGIGTDNVEILMNELDALVNIDLENRTNKTQHKSLNIIRIGTSGSLQETIPVDSFVISKWAVGIDGLNDFYVVDENYLEADFCNQLKATLDLRVQPYGVSASPTLFQHFLKGKKDGYFDGVTLTCAGFYAPQGRTVRFKHKIPDLLPKLQHFCSDGVTRLANLEMETAGYYLFGHILGHKMLSLNAVLANRITQQFSKKPEKQVQNLIEFTLERVVLL